MDRPWLSSANPDISLLWTSSLCSFRLVEQHVNIREPENLRKTTLPCNKIGDYRQEIPKATLNQISGRATPRQWSKYITSLMAIKLIDNYCIRISKDLKDSLYINDRLPKRGKFINKANTRIGNHSLRNWLQDLNSLIFTLDRNLLWWISEKKL